MLVKRYCLLLVAFTAILLICGSALADLKYSLTMDVTGGTGPQAEMMKKMTGGKFTVYVKDDKIRTEEGKEGGVIMIIRNDKKLMWTISPSQKTCSEISTEYTEKMLDNTDQNKKYFEATKVEKTNEKETINGYKCNKVIVTNTLSPNTRTEVWLTEDLDISLDLFFRTLKGFGNYSKKFQEGGLKGFPIKTKMNVGEIEMVTTVTDIQKTSLDDKLFEYPEGYTKIDVTEMLKNNPPQPGGKTIKASPPEGAKDVKPEQEVTPEKKATPEKEAKPEKTEEKKSEGK